MKKFVVMMGVLLWCAGCQSMDSGGEKCQRLGGVWNDILKIEKPGNYCLTGRVGSSEENGLTDLFKINRPTVGTQILASDVSIDLGGNVVGSSRVIALILGDDDFTNPVDVGNITIRNGYINSNTFGVLSFSPLQAALRKQHDYRKQVARRNDYQQSHDGSDTTYWDSFYRRSYRTSVSSISALQYLVPSDDNEDEHFPGPASPDRLRGIRPARANEYPVKNLHIENVVLYLTLAAPELGFFDRGTTTAAMAIPAGLLLYGAGSVVKNSVIEVREGSAIWIYGPNAVLENNTIIVHGEGWLHEADAAIRLIQADGSVVKNNRIVIVKGATWGQSAISLFDTGKIKVEGNIFYGIDRKEQIAKAFLGTVDMEESGSKFEPLDKAPLNAKNDKRSGTWWCKFGSFACPP